MDDSLHPLGFDRLLDWIFREEERAHTRFGVHEELARGERGDERLAMRRYGRRLDNPFGLAAGPHTQLSHNLVAGWLAGARYLELKTVQTLDRLEVARPCIDMTDEGYNCEWSQELPLDVSLSEYVDAWCAIRVLQRRADRFDAAEPGFLGNLSVGYDLAGIRGAKVQRFLDRVADCRGAIETRLAAAARHHPNVCDIPVPDGLSNHVTLSTMHGCPPDEIERIARHLISERGLHTAIKLNPTLLGPRELRALLNETLGYEVDVPDASFAHDLDFTGAVDLVRSLRGEAERAGVEFGIKLTNTLECRNVRGVLPGEMSYLSGRALHPISVCVAQRLQSAFDGALDLSFSGGADAANAADLVACGLAPVTVCSDLLRPGGILRLRQYIGNLSSALDAAGASDLDDFARRRAGSDDLAAAHLENLRAYADATAHDPRYRKDARSAHPVAGRRALSPFDCVAAPCVEGCPAGQDIPAYLHHTERGEDARALAVVLRDNPLPSITGMVCEGPCHERCIREHDGAALRIRDVKRFLARTVPTRSAAPTAPPTPHRVAIIGAGPAGLACALHLVGAGVAAEVFEARERAGGMVSGVIPAFRLGAGDIARDLERIEAAGVVIRYGETIDETRFAELRRDYDAVFVGVGAQRDRALEIPGEPLPGVEPALGFLAAARTDPTRRIAGEVMVLGGGNSAVDAARTAVRLGGRVRVVYRRTRAEMPAGREELDALLAEGIAVDELRTPLSIATRDDRLEVTLACMKLGEPDASGRRRPLPDGERTETRVVDLVIPAIGQRLEWGELNVEADGRVVGQPHVFTGGDARRGPDSIVAALADGRRAAEAMRREFGIDAAPSARGTTRRLDPVERQRRVATIDPPHSPRTNPSSTPGDFALVISDLGEAEARAEAARCLACDQTCDVCVSVCPNRAMIAWAAPPKHLPLQRVRQDSDGWSVTRDGDLTIDQEPQVLNLTDFCNHCGNCTTFCPTAGTPFLDKPRLAVSESSFAADDDVHRFDGAALRYRRAGEEERLERDGDHFVHTSPAGRVTLDAATFAVRDVTFAADRDEIDLSRAAAMSILFTHLADAPELKS